MEMGSKERLKPKADKTVSSKDSAEEGYGDDGRPRLLDVGAMRSCGVDMLGRYSEWIGREYGGLHMDEPTCRLL